MMIFPIAWAGLAEMLEEVAEPACPDVVPNPAYPLPAIAGAMRWERMDLGSDGE